MIRCLTRPAISRLNQLPLGSLPKPTIQVVSQSPRVSGPSAAGRVKTKTDPVQLHSKWTVKWKGSQAAQMYDVWYRKLATGEPAPNWDDLLDTSDGEFPPTPWKNDVASKQAKLTAERASHTASR